MLALAPTLRSLVSTPVSFRPIAIVSYAPDAVAIKEAEVAEADDDIHASDLEVDSEAETAPSDADDGSPVKKKPNKRPTPAAPREPSATAKQLQVRLHLPGIQC